MISDRTETTGARAAREVDIDRGLIGRRIFSEPDIYAAELKKIFGRCWLFLAHETQIPNPGDYITCRMGETPVIVTRALDGEVHALVNSCRHRGNAVTRNDAGNARTFTCPYHGWCYDLHGKRVDPGSLVALPGLTSYYDERLDLPAWGLIPVAAVGMYHGLVFATFDPEAPSLDEYLGDFRWFLDAVLGRGDFAAVPGIARWRMNCNWKFAADNAIGDNSHAQVAHRSAFVAMERHLGAPRSIVGAVEPGYTVLTDYGHGANCKSPYFERQSAPDTQAVAFKRIDPVFEQWRENAEIVARLGPARSQITRYNGNVFPNLFVIDQLLMLRNPIGPGETEIRAVALYDRNASPEVQAIQKRRAFTKFGPSGLLEQEDGENWDQATAGTRIGQIQDAALNYEMGVGRGRFVIDDQTPPRIETMINEHAQLWFYQAWADALKANDWTDLRANHTRPHGSI
jgi:phenylpropionate dioxygenase-like ring-hydroxylating dioxygenase large terminal subunit